MNDDFVSPVRWPNFFVIGGYRCGSTSFCDALGQHPDVFMCDPKEPNYFNDRPANSLCWPTSESDYLALFSGAHQSAVGEGTTRYSNVTSCPEACPRIHAAVPQAKILYIARNPLDQILSMEMHQHRWRKRPLSLDELLRHQGTIDRMRHWNQVQSFIELFSSDCVKLVLFEEFIREADRVLRDVFRFLEVDCTDRGAGYALAHQNAGHDKWIPAPWMKSIQDHPLVKFSSRVVPAPIRKRIVRGLGYQPTKKELTGEQRSFLQELLYEDGKKFLEFFGKTPDYWFPDKHQSNS